jgi:Tol biopolymer transport system component
VIGTTLSHFRITAKLGEGGMGVVYRAEDTRLGREVAVKVLPEAFTADPERLARFAREAKVLAALDHANIAAIHSFETAAPNHFLVMQLAPGETLAERLERGPQPLEEALPVALQIAAALEAAHEKGIIHRDLKPANVKVDAEGKVKVLDFGLAKALDRTAVSDSDPAVSPTLTGMATMQGVILGTAAYMAPEQAKGKIVDKRADIWAFGVVFYEMLTGRRLFAGDSASETLADVLKGRIDLSFLPAEVPPPIRRLLRRCLERDPKHRLHDIADARIVLEDVRSGRVDEAPLAAADRARRWPQRLVWLTAGVLLAAGAFLWRIGASGREARGSALPTFSVQRLTELPGPELHPSLSPDGRMVVYTSGAPGHRDLYVLRVGGDRAIQLTPDSPGDDEQAAFSPDGEQIAFRSGRDGGGIFVMGATGESVRRLTTAGYDPVWSPDGRFVAYSTQPVGDPYLRVGQSELWTVEIATGTTNRLLEGDAVQPTWSPTGERIAYWANASGRRDLWTVAATGGEPVPLTQDEATDWSPEWSPDARWLYFASDRGGSMNLWRIAVDPRSGGAAGAPQPVTTGVESFGYPRFSRDGSRLAVMAYDRGYEVTLYALDSQAKETARAIRTLRIPSAHGCRLSQDGSWLACSVVGAREDLVLLRSDGAELRRLTADPHKDRGPQWAPDGQRVAFFSTRSGKWAYWTIRTDGSDLRRLTPDGEGTIFGVLSPDGLRFVWSAGRKELWLLDVALGGSVPASPRRLESPAAPENFLPQAWSPQGDRIAGTVTAEGPYGNYYLALAIWSPDTGRFERLAVPPFGVAARAVAGWLPDGRRLVARLHDGVAVVDTVTGTSRIVAPAGAFDGVSLSRDGRTLLVEREVMDSDIWLLEARQEGGD